MRCSRARCTRRRQGRCTWRCKASNVLLCVGRIRFGKHAVSNVLESVNTLEGFRRTCEALR